MLVALVWFWATVPLVGPSIPGVVLERPCRTDCSELRASGPDFDGRGAYRSGWLVGQYDGFIRELLLGHFRATTHYLSVESIQVLLKAGKHQKAMVETERRLSVNSPCTT